MACAVGFNFFVRVFSVCHALARRLLERPELRATAKVVGILEPSRRRGAVVGVLKEEPGGGAMLLHPCDPRLPRCLVRSSELPNELKSALKARPSHSLLSLQRMPALVLWCNWRLVHIWGSCLSW